MGYSSWRVEYTASSGRKIRAGFDYESEARKCARDAAEFLGAKDIEVIYLGKGIRYGEG